MQGFMDLMVLPSLHRSPDKGDEVLASSFRNLHHRRGYVQACLGLRYSAGRGCSFYSRLRGYGILAATHGVRHEGLL